MAFTVPLIILLILLIIGIISFLLFKEKFDTKLPLTTDDPNSDPNSGPDDFIQVLGITDPSSQILISNSNGDLSLIPLSNLHAAINKVSQDGIVNNNTYYTKTVDLPNTYTTTDDLQKNYIQKGAYYSITNEFMDKGKTVHVDGSAGGATTNNPLIANDGTCEHGPLAYNFRFDDPCPTK